MPLRALPLQIKNQQSSVENRQSIREDSVHWIEDC
jgi:hypothetical protein